MLGYQSPKEFLKKNGTSKKSKKKQYELHQELTANEIAGRILKTELENYTNMNENDRYAFKEEMSQVPQLRYMNMSVLAAVLSYLNTIDETQNYQEYFREENIETYINRLIRTTTKKKDRRTDEIDEQIIRIRMKATFLRYLRFVVNRRNKLQHDEDPNTIQC